MADLDAQTPPSPPPPADLPESVPHDEASLKYLQFVHAAVLQMLLVASKAYDYAKDMSGPLKPGVETIAGTVKTVAGPIYDKYNKVPGQVLQFVDRKVDESVNNLDGRVPPIVKEVSSRAFSAAQMAPEAARSVATDVKKTGIVETASGLAKTVYTKYEPAAKELVSKYEPVAEQYAASAWRSLNQLPLVPQVAKVVGPTAAFCSEKYNQTVQQTHEKGYKVSQFLLFVPTERIAKVLSGGEGHAAEAAAPGDAELAEAQPAAPGTGEETPAA